MNVSRVAPDRASLICGLQVVRLFDIMKLVHVESLLFWVDEIQALSDSIAVLLVSQYYRSCLS